MQFWDLITGKLRTETGDPAQGAQHTTELRLYVGKATGKLAATTGHVATIKEGSQVILSRRDILQSVAIIGDPGSGKTSGAIRPFILHLLDQKTGLVILDGKNDLGPEVIELSQHLGRRVYRIGVGGLPFNLFDGLTPDQIGGILKQAFEITGAGGGTEGGDYWANQAIMRSKHALELLKYTPDHYSMTGLRKYVFYEDFRGEILHDCSAILDKQPESDEKKELREHLRYELLLWPQIAKSEKTAGVILSVLQNVIDRFSAPELARAFCGEEKSQAPLSELERGAVFVVDIPFDKYDAAAQVILIFLKEAVFRLIKARSRLPEAQKRTALPIGIVADEYQKVTGGTSDLNSIDTCRSLGGFMIVGFQSINSLHSVIRNPATVKAMLANLVQKIIFATSDTDTIEWVQKLFGNAEVYRENAQRGNSSSTGRENSYTKSENVTGQLVSLPVVTAQTFHDLKQTGKTTQGLAMFRIGGTTYSDVIECPKVYASDILTA